jgi:hypothetical protein
LDRIDLVADDKTSRIQLTELELPALGLLEEVIPHNTKLVTCHADNERTRVLHYAALALQILSVGIMSYANGHVGPIHPFFLMAPLHRIVLSGNQSDWRYPRLSAELVGLMCMSGLVRSPVLAFRVFEDAIDPDITTKGPADLWATPKDVIGTWGPAYS